MSHCVHRLPLLLIIARRAGALCEMLRFPGEGASWTLPHPRISSTEPPLPVAYVETSDTSVAGRRCIGVLTVTAKAGM